MQLLNKLMALLMVLIPSLGLGSIATQVGGAEKISDPKIIAAAGCFVLLEYVLGRTNLVKANSSLEFLLKSIIGPAIYHGLQLKRFGYKIQGEKQP